MNSLIQLAKLFPDESESSKPRPYFNHSVEFKQKVSATQRMQTLEEAGLNVFYFPSSFVSGCDMLSDSGTTTMTSRQWALMQFIWI